MKEYKELNKKNYLEYFDDYISIHQGRINDLKVILDKDFSIDNNQLDYSLESLDIIWLAIKGSLKREEEIRSYDNNNPIWINLEVRSLGSEEYGYYSEYVINIIDMLHHYLIEMILLENKVAKLVPYYEKGARRLNIQYKPVIEGGKTPIYILIQIFVNISKLNDKNYSINRDKQLSNLFLMICERFFNNLSKD